MSKSTGLFVSFLKLILLTVILYLVMSIIVSVVSHSLAIWLKFGIRDLQIKLLKVYQFRDNLRTECRIFLVEVIKITFARVS
jgi:hypothetical protein